MSAECKLCGALVADSGVQRHAQWHQNGLQDRLELVEGMHRVLAGKSPIPTLGEQR